MTATVTFVVEVPDGMDVDIFRLRGREALAAVAYAMVGHRVPRTSGLAYVRGDRERHEKMHRLMLDGFVPSLAAAAWEVAAEAHGLRERLRVAKRLVRSHPAAAGDEAETARSLAELARVRRSAIDRRDGAGGRRTERMLALAAEASKLERYLHDRND